MHRTASKRVCRVEARGALRRVPMEPRALAWAWPRAWLTPDERRYGGTLQLDCHCDRPILAAWIQCICGVTRALLGACLYEGLALGP
jgi:hypothetical protein